jgi:hypothetical protein
MTEQFHYTHNGRSFTMPHAKNIKVGVIRKAAKLPSGTQEFAVLEAILSDDALEVVDDMDAQEFEAFMKAWQKESGVTLGESLASSPS